MSFEIVYGGKEKENPPENATANEPYNKEAIKKLEDSNNVLMEPWNLCKYKSEVMEYTVKSCCRGQETRRGHTCLLIGTLDLNPLICSLCKKFSPKESI